LETCKAAGRLVAIGGSQKKEDPVTFTISAEIRGGFDAVG